MTDGQYSSNVGPGKLRPSKAWEIQPVKLLAKR
jgi:hypothetical protein